MTTPTRDEIFGCPMGANNAGAANVGQYLMVVAGKVWTLERTFNGERPFHEKGWRFEVIDALLRAGLASTASEAVKLVSKATSPYVDDPVLPDSMQGKTPPSWWDPDHDPFAECADITEKNATCDCNCTCGVILG